MKEQVIAAEESNSRNQVITTEKSNSPNQASFWLCILFFLYNFVKIGLIILCGDYTDDFTNMYMPVSAALLIQGRILEGIINYPIDRIILNILLITILITVIEVSFIWCISGVIVLISWSIFLAVYFIVNYREIYNVALCFLKIRTWLN